MSRRHSGFTLVEVLVALLVMAVMAGMAWQGVDGITRTRSASQERLEHTLRLNTVIAQWEQDLSSLQDSAVVPMALACDGASVRLTRRAPAGLQVVMWSLRPEGGSSAWTRWAGPVVTTSGALQDSWMRSLQLQGNEPGQLRALPGLAQWQVYFFQGNSWSNCQSTGDIAQQQVVTGSSNGGGAPVPENSGSGPDNGGRTPPPPVVRQALPTGVRLVLSFAPDSGMTGNLTRDTLLGP